MDDVVVSVFNGKHFQYVRRFAVFRASVKAPSGRSGISSLWCRLIGRVHTPTWHALQAEAYPMMRDPHFLHRFQTPASSIGTTAASTCSTS